MSIANSAIDTLRMIVLIGVPAVLPPKKKLLGLMLRERCPTCWCLDHIVHGVGGLSVLFVIKIGRETRHVRTMLRHHSEFEHITRSFNIARKFGNISFIIVQWFGGKRYRTGPYNNKRKINEQHSSNNGVNILGQRGQKGRKCGWIRVYTGPEMRTRQEMVPHIPKADLEFNEVWMN